MGGNLAMADVTYQSLQSQIQTQKGQIVSQRQTIQQEKITGERGIQSLKRVSPHAPPEVWFGERSQLLKLLKVDWVNWGKLRKN